jgi:hypothetical protein
MNRWQFVVHQQALEEIDKLRSAERHEVRAVLQRLTEDPWQKPDAQIRPPNDRVYLVKIFASRASSTGSTRSRAKFTSCESIGSSVRQFDPKPLTILHLSPGSGSFNAISGYDLR